MGFKYIVLILLGILLLFVLIPLLLLLVRRKRSKRKICGMTMQEKVCKLNELAEPFGFMYMPEQDIFISCRDAWQREMGYETLFDRAAVAAHIVIDARPVYFDYEGRTWLIEFWKGQYGINTGAEIGIYHADRILSEAEYKTALFNAASDHEMLPCTLRLYKNDESLAELSERHWWLTAFLPGCFSKPSELCLEASICFPNKQMCDAFCEGLCAAGYGMENICIHGLSVSLVFGAPETENSGLLTRFYRCLSQILNRMCCKLYMWVTRPFTRTDDKILYLYYSLPFIFRRLLRLRRFHRRCHRKYGCQPPKRHHYPKKQGWN